ncbi:hypothetical protein HAX54_042977 [Datura stramonium]|uniref:Uncharacterized protein n=1 Tax=Datura stramonium TaxID=4076 RepID=A0ABS8SMW8_DATST|nr:hypothetical protein [Datura stramonium]
MPTTLTPLEQQTLVVLLCALLFVRVCLFVELRISYCFIPPLKSFILNGSGYDEIGFQLSLEDDGQALAIATSMPELRHLALVEAILDGCPLMIMNLIITLRIISHPLMMATETISASDDHVLL